MLENAACLKRVLMVDAPTLMSKEPKCFVASVYKVQEDDEVCHFLSFYLSLSNIPNNIVYSNPSIIPSQVYEKSQVLPENPVTLLSRFQFLILFIFRPQMCPERRFFLLQSAGPQTMGLSPQGKPSMAHVKDWEWITWVRNL